MLIPVAICVMIGTRIRDLTRRMIYAVAQAIVLLHIYSNFYEHELHWGNVWKAFGLWAVWIGVYAGIFLFITSFAVARRKTS